VKYLIQKLVRIFRHFAQTCRVCFTLGMHFIPCVRKVAVHLGYGADLFVSNEVAVEVFCCFAVLSC
jgi:hypothetical protein